LVTLHGKGHARSGDPAPDDAAARQDAAAGKATSDQVGGGIWQTKGRPPEGGLPKQGDELPYAVLRRRRPSQPAPISAAPSTEREDGSGTLGGTPITPATMKNCS